MINYSLARRLREIGEDGRYSKSEIRRLQKNAMDSLAARNTTFHNVISGMRNLVEEFDKAYEPFKGKALVPNYHSEEYKIGIRELEEILGTFLADDLTSTMNPTTMTKAAAVAGTGIGGYMLIKTPPLTRRKFLEFGLALPTMVTAIDGTLTGIAISGIRYFALSRRRAAAVEIQEKVRDFYNL